MLLSLNHESSRKTSASARHKGQSGLKAVPPGAKAVASFVPNITRKAFEKYGFSAASLLTDWAAIIGPDLAKYTAPERLKWPRNVKIYADIDDEGEHGRPGATLIMRVDGAKALEIQYKTRQILDRINAYFGYAAIAQIRLLQAPVNHGAGAPEKTYQKLELPAETPPDIAAIEDDALREALRLMAAGVARRQTSN